MDRSAANSSQKFPRFLVLAPVQPRSGARMKGRSRTATNTLAGSRRDFHGKCKAHSVCPLQKPMKGRPYQEIGSTLFLSSEAAFGG